MKRYNLNNKLFYTNIINVTLILLIIFTTLFPYKYVYSLTINQEVFLKLSENILWRKIHLNLPSYLFILIMSVSTLRSE